MEEIFKNLTENYPADKLMLIYTAAIFSLGWAAGSTFNFITRLFTRPTRTVRRRYPRRLSYREK